MKIQEISQPIRNMNFQGLHWIEASAGTGKTFTLSSLMVRILLEKYLPRQIIATTFTRKAAAELKSRIRQRVTQILNLLHSLREVQVSDIQARAASEADELIQFILEKHAHQVSYACDRLQLVLDQFDELFVGTLDSFSQNLLREFAFESGKIERAEITADEHAYIRQLVHDHLRAWIGQQSQACVNALLQRQKLKNVDQYVDLISKSLNFSSAKLTEVHAPEFDLSALQDAFDHLLELDLCNTAAFLPFTDQGYSASLLLQPWSKSSIVDLIGKELAPCLQHIHDQGVSYLLDGLPEVLAKLKKFIAKSEPRSASGKKKIPDAEVDNLVQHPIFQGLKAFFVAIDDVTQDLDDIAAYIRFYIAQQVKLGLPQLLQSKGETTFNQQIRTLAEALQGEQGEKFAAYVHARYPLILVDEFQDTNLDQDQMLAAIWRHPQRLQQGCMIMVGDRKQAIYGFRGGDMLTFLKARQDVYIKQGCFYQLTRNFRSVAPLVEVVDALFQCQPDFGEDVHYVPISAGANHPTLYDEGVENPQPLRWLEIDNAKDEAPQVAWQIRGLLNQAVLGTLYFEKEGKQQTVTHNDIAVLASSHAALNDVQNALLNIGIAVDRASRRSVFSSDIAMDIAAMLSAILSPYQEAKVKRALLGRLMGFKLHQLWNPNSQQLDLSHYIAQFDHIRELWLNQSFLAAWQYCLDYFKIWERLVALPHRNNERDVVNLRHLTEILGHQSEQLQGAQHLYQWYFKQLNQPKEQEWDLERPLTSADGVKLMTIHQSKGLEFKFVFLLNANGSPKIDNDVVFSAEEQALADGTSIKHRVINVSGKFEQAEKDQTDDRRIAETHRLWYVALTRASYRIYAVYRKKEHKSVYSLPFWRGIGEPTFQHAGAGVQDLLEACPETIQPSEQQQQIELSARPLPEQRFYPRRNTSFSALSQHLAYQQRTQDQLALALLHEEGAEDEQDEVHESLSSNQPLTWIRQHFPKGTVAGTFLHSIYEHIDFTAPETWRLEVLRRFKNDGPQLLAQLRDQLMTQFELRQVFIQQWRSLYAQATQPLHAAAAELFGEQIAQYEQHKHLRAMYLQFNRLVAAQMIEQQSLAGHWQSLFAENGFNQEAFAEQLSALQSCFSQVDIISVVNELKNSFAHHAPVVVLEEQRALAWYQGMGFFAYLDLILNDMIYALMTQWMEDVVRTPLHQDFCLADLTPEQHLPEFSFQLSLADHPVAIRQIQQLFSDYGIQIEALNEANTARYLVGAIDLVYFDGQRYHIADYKSNFLGLNATDYQSEQIQLNMSQSSYWLQAALYLVALHRYLQCTLESYAIDRHLGGASYLYLRGMDGSTTLGFHHWTIPPEFILKLDRILGSYATEQNQKSA